MRTYAGLIERAFGGPHERLLPLLVLLTLPAAVQAQFTFTTNNGAITITGYTGPGGAVTIPSRTNGYSVTSIGTNAFFNCTSVTSVLIPNTVGTIASSAFQSCTSLTSVTLFCSSPPACSIGDSAFAFCTSLTNVAMTNRITSIGDYAFTSCSSLTTITLPNSLYNIGEGLFSNCTSLTSISIPDIVHWIGTNAFYDCVALTDVVVSLNVQSINDGAFYGCTNLTGVYCQGWPPALGSYVFDYDNNTTVYYLPAFPGWGTTFGGCPTMLNPAAQYTYTTTNGIVTVTGYSGSSNALAILSTINGQPVTGIGEDAFNGSRLTSVTIPNSVTWIGVMAFGNETSLTNLMIGSSVTSIGRFLTAGCTKLTAIRVDALNSTYSGVDGVLFDKSQTTLIEYPEGITGSYAVPDGVTSIGDGAFVGASLTEVMIPISVTNIASQAFDGCANLTGAYFSGNAPSADSSVFSGDHAIAYYLPGTTGWDTWSGGCAAVLWNPQPQLGDGSFGVQTNHFGFNITGTTNIPIVVEACTNLATASWTSLQSCTLSNGSIYFSDAAWTNYAARFYRIRSP